MGSSRYLPGKTNPSLNERLQNHPEHDPEALSHVATPAAASNNATPRRVTMLTRSTAVAHGAVIPNLARISSDLMQALGSHAEKLAIKSTNGEGLDSKDIDAIDKCVKALEKLRDIERDMTQTESGKDVTDMTDEEIRAMLPHVQRMLAPPQSDSAVGYVQIDTTAKGGDTPEAGGGSRGPFSSGSPTKK